MRSRRQVVQGHGGEAPALAAWLRAQVVFPWPWQTRKAAPSTYRTHRPKAIAGPGCPTVIHASILLCQ